MDKEFNGPPDKDGTESDNETASAATPLNKEDAPDSDTINSSENKKYTDNPIKPAYQWIRFTACPWIAKHILLSSRFWTAAATVAIAATTIIYTIYARGQWRAMLKSNEINHDSLVSVQRAFITFPGISLDTAPASVKTKELVWAFTAMEENSGTTPAIDTIQYFTGSELPDEPSEDQFIGNNDYIGGNPDNPPVGEIGPKIQKGIGPVVKDNAFILGKYPLTSIGTAEFQAFFHSHRTFFWGWIGYRDVFPDTRPHVTEFCEEVNGIAANMQQQAKGVVVARPAVHLKDCNHYNCTDEHCKDYQTIAAKVPQ